jgi:hypothetical protein
VPTTPIQLDTRLIRPAAGHTVYTRARWTEDWTEVEHLYCDYLVFAAAPSVATAGFSWRFGAGLRPGEQAFGEVAPLDLLQHYVKVEIDSPPDAGGNPRDPVRWHGIFLEDAWNSEGAFVRHKPKTLDQVERTRSGEQSLAAYGLEVLLARQRIRGSWWLAGAGDERYLERPLEINAENRYANAGNRSKAPGPAGTHLFAGDLSDTAAGCDWWSTRDVIEYLLEYHAPVDQAGNRAVPFLLAPSAKPYLPTWDRPRLRLEGRTVKDVLDELLNRRRLLGYWVRVFEGQAPGGGDAAFLLAFNYLDAELELPGGERLLANPRQRTFDGDAAPAVDGQVTHVSASQTYDLVEAIGRPALCCGAMAHADGTLLAGWTAAEETVYETGGSASPAWAAATKDVRERLNADARSAEKVSRVYSQFRLPADWDGKVGDGLGGAKQYLFPYDDLGIDPADVDAWYTPDLRFERELPLKIRDPAAAEPKWEYRALWAAIKTHDPNTPAGSYYCDLQRHGNYDAERTGEGAGRAWSCHVRALADAPGVELRISGAPQHVIASGLFSGNAADTRSYGAWTFNELIVCFAMRADWRVGARWPVNAAANEVIRTLTFGVPDAELHYVVPGTPAQLAATDAAVGQLAAHAGGLVRDDRPRLEQLARLAYEWYGTFRQSLSLSVRGVLPSVYVGDLITSVGAEETAEDVRSVVTEIRYDLAAAEGDVDRTRIQTHWGELDVLKLLY